MPGAPHSSSHHAPYPKLVQVMCFPSPSFSFLHNILLLLGFEIRSTVWPRKASTSNWQHLLNADLTDVSHHAQKKKKKCISSVPGCLIAMLWKHVLRENLWISQTVGTLYKQTPNNEGIDRKGFIFLKKKISISFYKILNLCQQWAICRNQILTEASTKASHSAAAVL